MIIKIRTTFGKTLSYRGAYKRSSVKGYEIFEGYRVNKEGVSWGSKKTLYLLGNKVYGGALGKVIE